MLARPVYLRAWAAMMSLALVAPRPASAQAYPPQDDPPPAPRAPASPPEPPLVAPPGYHVERHVRPWVPITGGVIFGLFYGLAVDAGVQSHCANDRWLMLPVFGPLAAAAAGADRSSSELGGCDDPEGFKHFLYWFDGVGQFVGAGLLLSALAFTKSEIVPDRKNGAPPDRPLMSWQIAPSVGAAGGGVSVVGTF